MESTKGTICLGVNLREGVTRTNFIFLSFIAFLCMTMNILPVVLQPLFLQEVIGINRQHIGKINASLSVLVEISIILLVGVIGILSDKIGRRGLLVTGFTLTGIFILGFGSSHIIADFIGIDKPLLLVYVFRFFIGFSMLLVWPQIQSLFTDYTFIAGRGKAMAVMGFMFTAGSLFCFSFIARLPKIIGLYNTFFLSMLIAIAASIISRAGLIELVDKKKKEKVNWKEVFRILKESPCLKITFATAFASRADVVIFGMFTMIWAIKVAKEFGRTPMNAMSEAGIIVAMASIIGLLCYPAWGYLSEKWGKLKILALGLFLAGSGLTLMIFITNPFSIWMKVCVFIFALGTNGVGVGASTLTSNIAPRNIIGSVLGGYHTAAAIGIMVFVQAGGFLFDLVAHSWPFVLTGIADLLVVVFILMTWKKAHAEEEIYNKKKFH